MAEGARKAIIKNSDMSEEMQQEAIDLTTYAFEKFNIEKDIAAYIKKEVSFNCFSPRKQTFKPV